MSNPNPYTPPSLHDIGLKKHLDRLAEKNNDYAYKDFVKAYNSGLSISGIATLFGVSWQTAQKWVKQHRKEVTKTDDSI